MSKFFPCWLCAFLCLSYSLHAQHENIEIYRFFSPNETAICIDPENTQRMVAAANLDHVFYSEDAGQTWTRANVGSEWGIWGDPVIGIDTSGAFYYLHLSNPSSGNWIDRIVAQKSTDGGMTWSNGSYMGLNGTKAQDKHWIAVDRNTNTLYVTWTQFDEYGSSAPTDSSTILFSKSTDGGETWTDAIRINRKAGDCIDSDDTTEGAVPTVGPNGEIYVCWAYRDSLWFDRSTDGGDTWLDEDIFVAEQITGWDFNVAGIYRANGLPVTVCDLSGGPHHGTIYVNFADVSATSGDKDIWLVKSTDSGNTWSDQIRVNDDPPGREQFFTWMAVDQVTGYLWFVFYDRRRTDGDLTDVFMALSKDGGMTFKSFQISESSFDPSSNYFIGDYNNVAAHNNVVRPIWTRLDNDDLSIWTALIETDSVVSVANLESEHAFSVDDPYPNPASDETGIAFKLHKRALVSLSIVDMKGSVLGQPMENVWRDYGVHLEKIDLKDLRLAQGMYYLVLTIEGAVAKRKVLHIE